MDWKLKPCPFCGKDAYLPVAKTDSHGNPHSYQASCKKGCVILDSKGDGSKAAQVRFWNHRADTSLVLRDVMAAIQAEIDNDPGDWGSDFIDGLQRAKSRVADLCYSNE